MYFQQIEKLCPAKVINDISYITVLPYTTLCNDDHEDDDDDMEDELELRLEMDGEPVVLHLKKNDHVTADTPVYTSEGKVVKLWDKTNKPVSIS